MQLSARVCSLKKPLCASFFTRIVAVLAVLAWAAPLASQVSRVTPVVQAVRKNRASVVAIYHPGKPTAFATGIIVHEKGYVMTNAHVVAAFKTLAVKLFDGTELTGTVLVVERDHDLAIIRLDTNKKLKALLPTPNDDLEVGETAIAIGNPFGYTNTVTTGIISALNRSIVLPNGVTLGGLIQFDVPINPGNSGGPLLNINGELIGINVAIREGAQGISFAINANTIELISAKHFRPVMK